MEKTTPRLSAVAEEFQELDLIFASGSDLDVVEKGYARKLIHAISREDEVLTIETLKSLGDLHLHKAKSNEHKAENFHRACALYEDVLRYIRNEEEKAVIQHRIRYAEKCTKLVYSKKYTKAETGLTVAELLHGVEKKAKVKEHDVVPLREGYTDAFVDSIVERNKGLEVESLKSLGDLYLEKGRVGRDEAAFTKAAGLYRAALDRCEDSDGRETLKHRIKYTEKVKGKAEKRREKPTGNSKADYAKWLVPPSTACKAALDVISQINKKRIAGADSHMNNKTPADTESTTQ
uniref:Uncharacterized protein n=1 Tax=Branchiostoma floridae TaxID=7739 RepID=C3ZPQ7_BRAFL|eukprot:XP_002589467.1 hypothetical protein BRAFLDRAFT_80109 [Branchiostoma floridae]